MMKVETFYVILNSENRVMSGNYAQTELSIARQKAVEYARENPGQKFHIMKRLSSVTANDLQWEDSQ
jgi:hypothetical protein